MIDVHLSHAKLSIMLLKRNGIFEMKIVNESNLTTKLLDEKQYDYLLFRVKYRQLDDMFIFVSGDMCLSGFKKEMKFQMLKNLVNYTDEMIVKVNYIHNNKDRFVDSVYILYNVTQKKWYI